MIDVWQYSEYALDSEYATTLNILGSHKVVNKIFHHKYLTGFWICLEFWKYQCYTVFCKKQPVIHVWQVFEYSLGSQSYRAWIYMVVNMSRLHIVLHQLYFKDSHYFQCLEFWICEGYTRLLKNSFIIDAWQDTKYFSDSEHATVLNMPGYARFCTKLSITDIW